jgi:hypothetical protein
MMEDVPSAGGRDDSVARLSAAVEANDDGMVGVFRSEVVGDEAFAFIAEVRADDGGGVHLESRKCQSRSVGQVS